MLFPQHMNGTVHIKYPIEGGRSTHIFKEIFLEREKSFGTRLWNKVISDLLTATPAFLHKRTPTISSAKIAKIVASYSLKKNSPKEKDSADLTGSL